MNPFDAIYSQLTGFWKGLNGAQRVALASVALLTAGAMTLLLTLANEPSYTTLFANLEPGDASRLIDELETQQVPFKLTHAGTAIQVPLERVYDLRLELASKGLLGGGPVGFEVFDDGGLGTTPFQERVRFRRALEGELSRTISQIDPVLWTRVHINLPDRRVFRREQTRPTASVVVSLESGERLAAGEVQGIQHLVAGAVEGLAVDQVTVLDTSGRMLAKAGGEDDDLMAAEVMDVQKALERRLERRAQGLLDAALGPQTSVVTVSAEIDRRRVEEDRDRVNPDETVVLSEQRTEETRTEPGLTGGAGGIPGAAANVPGGPGGETGGSGVSEESITRETINFEVSRSRSKTVMPMGETKRLSVAVIVDGSYEAPPAAEGDDAEVPPVPVYKPRTPEELSQITEIVKRAVGFNEERGDAIEVQNLPFRSPLDDVAAGQPPFWQSPELFVLLPNVARTLAILLGMAMLIFLVIRPALKQLTLANVLAASSAAGGSPEDEDDEEIQRLLTEAEKLSQRLTKENPKVVADAMKQWLRE